MRRQRALLALIVLLGSGCHYLNHNLRTVEAGAFYRSGQMGPAALERTLTRLSITGVINLRGASPDATWYQEELAVCAALEVAHDDLDWSMSSLPTPESLANFVRLVESREGPLLVHCQGGTHRSGVASAVYVILQGGDMKAARRQLDIFFNDAPIGGVLDLYEAETNPPPFADWVDECYPQRYTAE